MNPIERRNAFTFAEIVVAAPWLSTMLPTSQDNDKADMLQRNRWADEGLPAGDVFALEAEARRARAAYLVGVFARVGVWVRSWRHRGVKAAHV
jgi:hypothetical protein